jgi:DNA primase large subunit
MALDDVRRGALMTHLFDALERGEDIGHYGRLTFAMIAHNYLDRDDLVDWLSKDKSFDQQQAKALVQQVEERDYNPPSRRRILEWQAKQDFPICPTPEDPDACNPYQDLAIPHDVLENIEEYREQQFDAEEAEEAATR